MDDLKRLVERARELVACDNENAARQAVDELPSSRLSLLHRKLVQRGWPSEGPVDATPNDTHAPFQYKDALTSYLMYALNSAGVDHHGRAESPEDDEQSNLF